MEQKLPDSAKFVQDFCCNVDLFFEVIPFDDIFKIVMAVFLVRLFYKEVGAWRTGRFSRSGLFKDIRVELITLFAIGIFVLTALILYLAIKCPVLNIITGSWAYAFIFYMLTPLMNSFKEWGAQVDPIISFYEKIAEKIKEKFLD